MGSLRALGLVSIVALATIAVGVASADRAATRDERRAIARVIELPTKCTEARVSTVTERPKWALAYWIAGAEKCEPFASNGVTVLKFKNGRWRFVTAGSSFTCEELYDDVPRRVVRDLGLKDTCI